MCCIKIFQVCKTPMEIAVLGNTSKTDKSKAKSKGSSTKVILALQFGVVSFYPSQSKPGSVKLANYMVN